MTVFRVSMAASWVLLVGLTLYVVSVHGFDFMTPFFGDMLALDWRSQFNIDFLIILVLLASWVYWRETSTARSVVFGLLMFLGGMVAFAYLLYASYAAKGNVKAILLGSHYKGE